MRSFFLYKEKSFDKKETIRIQGKRKK